MRVFDCDVQDALLFVIVIISMIHDFLSFYIVVSKCEERKVEAFSWSAPGDSNIAKPLQLSMRWDITSLVKSVNLIYAKKVYYSNRPKYVFFASTAESRATFQKLILDRVSKFGWMKN